MSIQRIDPFIHIVKICVVAAPVISPFVFTDDLEEGMRASVVCSVTAGDPPVTLSWFKDGIPIESGTNDNSIQIVAITEFVSSLIINRLDRRFSGNYTCQASTEVGSVNHTARMTVRFRPIWLLKPTNMAAVAGNGLRLDCLADGYPHPVIRWKVSRKDPFITSSSSSANGNGASPIAILSSPRIHVLENGSLIIKTVQTSDQGRYVCELSNGIGKSQESAADIVVYEKPVVRPLSTQITVKQMERVELICRAEGSTPLTFDWYKSTTSNSGGSSSTGGNHLNHSRNQMSGLSGGTGIVSLSHGSSSSSSSQYTIREETNIRDKVSILSINMASRNDSTIFTCRASNYYGSDQADLRLVVQEPPEAPTDIRTLEITSRSISLSWTLPYNGNSLVTGYEVVHKLSRGLCSTFFPSFFSSFISFFLSIFISFSLLVLPTFLPSFLLLFSSRF